MNSKIITAIVVAALTISGFAVGIICYQSVYASTDQKPVTAAAIRAESLSVYKRGGYQIIDVPLRANKGAIERFIQRERPHRMIGTLKYGYADGGENRTLETRIDVSYNKEEKTYTFTLTTTGDKIEKFDELWIADGTYNLIEEKDGKFYVETGGTRTQASDDNAVYRFLKYYRMGALLYTDFISNQETECYSLWDGGYYGRSYKSDGYAVFKNPGVELRTYHNKPVVYRYCYKDPNTGIERLFELNFEYPAPPDESAAMRTMRYAKYLTIKDNGTELDPANLSVEKAALTEFIEYGENYRMEGDMRYGFVANNTKQIQTKIEMSYNADHDIYKFKLKNKDLAGYAPLKDDKFAPFFAADGTYYIVHEDGKTYVLSDCNKEKKVTDVSADASLYNFLMGYCMENLIKTNFMNGRDDAEYSFSYHWKDGDYYHRTYPAVDYKLWVRKIEFKTYKDKPVKYEHCGKIAGSDVEFKFIADYRYNYIPQDVPAVADWK